MVEKDNNTKKYITMFVTVLLAVVFIAALATQTNTVTEKTQVTDESYNLSTSCYVGGEVNESVSTCNYTVTNAPTSWKQEDCPLASVVVTNYTGTELTLDTDYRLYASTGIIQFLNTTDTNETGIGTTALIDYQHCGTGYVNSSWGRSILGVNIGLLAIAILLAAVWLVYSLLEKRDDD